MKKSTFLFILFLFLNTIILFAQSDKSLLVLDNYSIPIGEKGALIGKVISSIPQKVILVKDTAKLFTVDKQGNIRLKKNIAVNTDHPFRYEIILKYGKMQKLFELVKDDFLHNKVIAHRGAWKNQDASQNSLKALRKAIEIGCEASEFDVWLSSDNRVVLSHDPVIGGKKVEETISEELFKIPFKDGDYLPSLEEYIDCIKKQNKTRLILEVKASQKGIDRCEAVADSSVQVVHRMKAQAWVDYITFSYDAAKRIRALDSTAKILYLEAGKKTLGELKADKITGIDFHLSHFIKDSKLVDKAKSMGLLTNVWTVNKEDDMKTMLNQAVDYITTDEPELLLELLEK